MKFLRICVLVCFVACGESNGFGQDDVDFNRDIRPVLAARCFACHGPDENAREADLRLDRRAAAIESGAIVAGKSADSELLKRIQSHDADERMPPPSAGAPLTGAQQKAIAKWIDRGARYDRHWAFVPPVEPDPPETDSAWPRNEIDHFVLQRMRAAGLSPSPKADRLTLVRRVYLDLIGLPPTPEQAQEFVDDRSPRAWEKLVDRLLNSKHYGERWARQWLDLARYADTNGYEKDRPRSIWMYRDWVIRAINKDMPFDQFSIEQLAGDMLPNATESQQIATGFHRNTMLNEEGGIDPLEYRFYAMVDRVATTGTVWMGLTTGCAQCHTHKYDPITHTDYYRFMALLNNANEPDLIVQDPTITKKIANINRQIANLEAKLPAQFPMESGDGSEDVRRKRHLEKAFKKWLSEMQDATDDWFIARPHSLESNLPRLSLQPDGSILSSGDITKRDVFVLKFNLQKLSDQHTAPIRALRLEVLPDDRLPARGPGRAFYEGRKGDFFLSELSASVDGTKQAFADGHQSYGKISIGNGKALPKNVFDSDGSTGWSTSGQEGQANQLVLNFQQPLPPGGELKLEFIFERHFAASLGKFRLWTSSKPKKTATNFPTELERDLTTVTAWNHNQMTPTQLEFLRRAPQLASARKPIDQLRKRRPGQPITMVMSERAADNIRPTFRHHRGEFVSPKERVEPGLPGIFSESKQQPTNRLELARWLVSAENPLVARVVVNRSWRALFGRGIVETSGDFGTQSNPPTHPELLDWLAIKFMQRGWRVKDLHRQIVNSATYQQTSAVRPELLRQDPGNLWLARAARFRVDAEMVRDIMLQCSGQLSEKMYGPGVYPPQPASVTALAYGNSRWPVSTGEDRYRRSIYTFTKRTAPFAAFTVFDAPSGEGCIARRNRSNTPLQALTLLNDDMYLDLSRQSARTLSPQVAPRESVRKLFRQFLTREPTQKELQRLDEFRTRQLQRLRTGELDAIQITHSVPQPPLLLFTGLSPAPIVASLQMDTVQQRAAFVLLARVIMNLDETITRQ